MTTQASRQFAAPANPLQIAASLLKSFYINAAAVLDVIIRARAVTANVQQMADMLKEAQRVEKTAPARAAQLRAAARRLELA